MGTEFDTSQLIEYLVYLGAFVLCGGLVFFFGYAMQRLREDPIGDRLAASARGETPINGREPAGGAFTESLASQLPQARGDNGALDRELRRAGYYRPAARYEFLAMRNGLVILAVITAGIIAVWLGPEQDVLALQVLVVGFLAAVLLWGVPRIILNALAKQRVQRIRRGLPDALDMITMCLTGGLSLPDSLSHVSREIYFSHPDLAVEFSIVRQQADMTSLDMSFRQFARRIDTPEIVSIAALVTQGQRLGTDVVTSIRDYADSMRLKRRQENDERSSKAGVKLLFPLVMCLLPSVFIILWGPAVLELSEFLRNFDIGSFGPENFRSPI